MTTSLEVREDLVRALRLDLVGPDPGSPLEAELLPQPPSRWYLTGFLVPREADEAERSDPTADEGVDEVGAAGGGDDGATPDRATGRRAFLPSSMGVSVLVPPEAARLRVKAVWGEYRLEGGPAEPPALEEGEAIAEPVPESGAGAAKTPGAAEWRRTQRVAEIGVPVGDPTPQPRSAEVPDSGGLRVVTSVRALSPGMASGGRAVSVFLVNDRRPAPDDRRDEGLVFQVRLELHGDRPFVARPNVRGLGDDDPDEQVADLQYRDAFEYAVGHGVATEARLGADGQCCSVATAWIPAAEVEKVEPADAPGVELSMEALAACGSADEVRTKVGGLVDAYRTWIQAERAGLPADPARAAVGEELMRRAEFAADRIDDGLQALGDAQVLDAFRIANRAMAAAARQRAYQQGRGDPGAVAPPVWRPFQLAFLLMSLRSLADPGHPQRDVVDLLFFPTGGGKTEAYLALAAFVLVLRRLRHPGLASAGVAVLMRYTLRLLTLDQLGRAATLICALELERQQNVELLGPWPFEIGLWVGQAATPNRMGRTGDQDAESARARTIAFQNDDRKPSPIPLESCPWCGTKFTRGSFTLQPSPNAPTDLRVVCANRRCAFTRDRPLPIVAVDEPIYRRLPCFLIATVDKFAALPWVGHTGALLGKVDRADRDGFYGPCDPARGRPLDAPLLPPELVIQDELHLISGPLGTMVGLYETAIDALCTRQVEGKAVRPKVVASTATVRRAEAQIRALFARSGVEIFPPPGPDRRDSFFARTMPTAVKPARLYVGVAASGRSLKVVTLRTSLALLAAAEKAFRANDGERNPRNPADPYMTLVGYFNSLRELGGTRRIVEDEVRARLRAYERRRRMGETEGPFASRTIRYEAVELTSRESTSKVAETKRRLALPFGETERVDVALATNMISVGLDILRLGLMLVLGQPKTTAEYIQATSRVGRDDARPGLVVTLLNVHKPRDRSHYERFAAYHASFYRSVEATSVTPFSPRAIDRGLAAVTVALARLGSGALTAPLDALQVTAERARLGYVADALAERAELLGGPPAEVEALRKLLRGRVGDLLDEWARIADQQRAVGAGLQYQREVGAAPPLLFEPLDPALADQPANARKFKAQRSLRDVEPSVSLYARRLGAEEDAT